MYLAFFYLSCVQTAPEHIEFRQLQTQVCLPVSSIAEDLVGTIVYIGIYMLFD